MDSSSVLALLCASVHNIRISYGAEMRDNGANFNFIALQKPEPFVEHVQNRVYWQQGSNITIKIGARTA